jgi:5-methylcytosine-specific restriction endonuclease McrA
MERTIVLNGDYSFLNTVSWKRGLRLILTGKTEVVKNSEKTVRCSDGTEMPIPLVVKLIKVIRMIYKNRVPYSKKNVMIRDNYTCVYCGRRLQSKLTIDHMIPSSRGGKTSFENCVAACRPCNHKKGNKTPSEANMFLRKQPYSPTISEFFRIKMKSLGLEEILKDLGVY